MIIISIQLNYVIRTCNDCNISFYKGMSYALETGTHIYHQIVSNKISDTLLSVLEFHVVTLRSTLASV